MSVRTPVAAVDALLREAQRHVSCVSPSVLVREPGRIQHSRLGRLTGGSAVLRGPRSVVRSVVFESSMQIAASGAYLAEWSGYRIELGLLDGPMLLAYHQILRFASVDLGVEPRREDWESVLARLGSQTMWSFIPWWVVPDSATPAEKLGQVALLP